MDYYINRAVETWDKDGKPIIAPPMLVIMSDNPNEGAVYIDLSEIYQAWGHYAYLLMGEHNADV